MLINLAFLEGYTVQIINKSRVRKSLKNVIIIPIT